MTYLKKNTWWESPKSKRFFVIVGIWWSKPGEISSIELLEKGQMNPVIIGEQEMLTLIEKNELTQVLHPEY